jgi:hypothetical protein
MQKSEAGAFVDPAGYKKFIDAKTAEFRAELKHQRGR